MELTYYGHSCFLLETKGYKLLFDPFISGNPLLGDTAPKIDLASIPADYILLSHGHGDHLLDVEEIVKNTGASFISNYEIITWLEGKGHKGHPMNHGGHWQFPFGTVKYVTAIHSSMLPDGSYGGNPGGFVLWNEEGCIYFAGDTALTLDMQLIPMTCPPLDYAILPIGDNFTMNASDAAIAAEFVRCEKIIGCHYDTFGYIKIDKVAASKAFTDKGKQLKLPTIGENWDL
jgi:L-ascorbate metabolism protein UlaG (beta-lactamase superfamily)